jgi:hypothetical protein
VQITHVVDPQVLFPPEYPYTSGTTRILRENFANLYAETRALLNLGSDDLVIDIGSNDGTLLSNFTAGGHRVLGIEPSLMAEKANATGIRTMMVFFSAEVARRVLATEGPARLIGERGVFVSESHYLFDLVRRVQYDTIYHEHLRYYSLMSLTRLLESAGLTVFRAKRIPTHGGSIRVFAAVKPRKVEPSVGRLLTKEEKAGITRPDGFRAFVERARQSKLDLYRILRRVNKARARVFGVGAPSRASTLINYVGLDAGLVECVVEVPGSHKIGKYIPGSDIPVDDEVRLFAEQPEYALIFSWHISKEITARLRQRGFRGKFIVPLPRARVLP